ncbi:TetR/AcrR family transcriptional regulator [Rummeliibacillus sp. NPDC094406]|uniref:TetR/AcrR family transcriptional regulator n=1 Tax=Rummeliibacillus sp. NPDC094406 TaxID=3364511 RepID=UPI00380FF2A6
MISKKDKIAQSALKLFTEQGFKATTTKEIALKSDVAESLIFYYFKDKTELLNHLIREFSFIGSMSKEMKELYEMDPIPALIQLGHLYSDFLYLNKSFLSFIWSPEMIQNKDVNVKVVDLIHSMSQEINTHLTRAVSVPIEKETIEMAASMFLSTLLTHFLVGERASDEFPLENDNYIKNVVTLILNGLDSSN